MNKILILCTGNSARSQMAEAYMSSFDESLEVYSAGVAPAKNVSRFAVAVMKEDGIDISSKSPKDAAIFTDMSFDYVITVCDHARETCPVFSGKVEHMVHIGFEDPDEFNGSDDNKTAFFRKIRDQIKTEFGKFYEANLSNR